MISDDKNKEQNVRRFLELVKKTRRGKFKVYIGMSAGVGKTYRMLQEAHALVKNGIDLKIAYIETHNRTETHAMLGGLPLIPRRRLFYKGKELEELDVDAVLQLHPEVVVVDELAHTNIGGSKNEKRWQDVLEILDAGISVISAVNIQHIESLNDEIQRITGIDVAERIPDIVLAQADDIVNIDLTADELIARLRDGKIYQADKIGTALKNFFKTEHILQLRELALKEVASHVERQIEAEVPRNAGLRAERFMACISSNSETAKMIIRKTSRLASYYNSKWFVLYVQTSKEGSNKIDLAAQRHLINNFKVATQLGAEILRVTDEDVAAAISQQASEYNITTICLGKPTHRSVFHFFQPDTLRNLLRKISDNDTDIIILS